MSYLIPVGGAFGRGTGTQLCNVANVQCGGCVLRRPLLREGRNRSQLRRYPFIAMNGVPRTRCVPDVVQKMVGTTDAERAMTIFAHEKMVGTTDAERRSKTYAYRKWSGRLDSN